MKQWVIAGALAGSLAFAGGAQAQQAAQSGTQPAAKPSTTTQAAQPSTAGQAKQTAKPAKKATQKKTGDTVVATGETRAPKQQPTTAQDPAVAEGAMALGAVHIPKAVKADNKPLAAGTYQVRLTTDEAKPDAVGTSGKLERWVEFVKGGKVAGREVVTIVPQSEIGMVQKDAPPAKGGSKVEMLKGGEYMRVWINKGGTHYLIHLPVGA